MNNENDITPNPKVLRMLGEIDFKPWQCFAELIDNAIDSFKSVSPEEKMLKPTVYLGLPNEEEFKENKATIFIRDNGPGMSEEELNNCVRAGYSGNDPVDRLGLFGMGFNIATARLGTKTEIWTARVGDQEWHGTTIDFDQLEREKKFTAPRLKKAKDDPDEHGTHINISNLHRERTFHLTESREENQLRTQLGKIYGKFMVDNNLTIKVNRLEVKPYRHCVWTENRFVKVSEEKIPAIIKIDRKLEPRNFCKRCWIWMSNDIRECENCGKSDLVASRERRVKGWIGIQRHFDFNNYGIDFIRNGRKIVIGEKSLFYWLNPDTMTEELEYPIDMVGREGGRIVGEIEIDHVKVSHQKDAFQKSDPEWHQAITIIRGESPLRPNIAEKYNLPPNESPLAKMFKGYRRGDPGIRYLVPGNEVGRNMNETLKEWARKFHSENPEFQSDKKWYEAVLIGDKARKSAKRPSVPLEDSKKIEKELLQEESKSAKLKPQERFKEKSVKEKIMSREYSISGINIAPIQVDVFKVSEDDEILREEGGKSLPLLFQPELSGPCICYYNPNHDLFEKFQYSPHEMILFEIASHIYTMLGDTNLRKQWPISLIFTELIKNYYPSDLIDYNTLSTRAQDFLSRFSEDASELIRKDPNRAFDILNEQELEYLIRKVAQDLHQGADKIDDLKKSGKFLIYVPPTFIPRLVRGWPEAFLDEKYWNVPYKTISLKTEEATNNLREEQLNRMYSMLMDIIWLVESRTPSKTVEWKEEVLRARHSLNILEMRRMNE